LKKKIRITQKVPGILTGHGNTRAYLHGFKTMDKGCCVCQQGDQTINQLLYDYNLLESQKQILMKNTTKNGQWPADKHELITNHLEPHLTYIESIDFNQL
jgi:hypothetical protein